MYGTDVWVDVWYRCMGRCMGTDVWVEVWYRCMGRCMVQMYGWRYGTDVWVEVWYRCMGRGMVQMYGWRYGTDVWVDVWYRCMMDEHRDSFNFHKTSTQSHTDAGLLQGMIELLLDAWIGQC